ncbi:MAG: 2-oxoacid:ferredoxin oxidoreductase subunit beta [Planctomycetota bacterium]
MSDIAPATKTNRLGLTKDAYEGSASTMCKGCGHDRISEAVIEAAFRSGLQANEVIKMSGIGCSSKTPAYFLGSSFGFNSTHGRMPSFTTGAHVANPTLLPIGVSGDGDTASIGIGQFVHMVRRNPRALYLVENNGVYGLTKGQFSATADRESPSKRGAHPTESPIDLCALAIQLGCGFVARSFSGDKKQLIPLLQAAFVHNGLAFIDVISPCVTFNNHDESTKSYTYHKEHEVHFHDPHFVPSFDPIDVDYDAGTTEQVRLHDGSRLLLTKLGTDYDPRDRVNALRQLAETHGRGEVLTGLIHFHGELPTLVETLSLGAKPLAALGEAELRPSREAFDQILAQFR